MHIILADGTRLNHIGATGASKYVQGANRDTITFEFDGTYSVDALREAFTETNCEVINIVTDEEQAMEDGSVQAVHADNYWEGYVIRTEVAEKAKELAPATGTTPAVTETRVFVTMAQRTYLETLLARNTSDIMDTQIAVAELAEMVTGG